MRKNNEFLALTRLEPTISSVLGIQDFMRIGYALFVIGYGGKEALANHNGDIHGGEPQLIRTGVQ